MKNIEIRGARDEKRVFKLIKRMFPKASPSFSSNDSYYVATVGKKDVGFLHLIQRKGRILLQGVGVVRGYRERGIGGRLVDRAIKHANALGMDILLKVKPMNCPAINLYVKKGFSIKKVRDSYILERKRFT